MRISDACVWAAVAATIRISGFSGFGLVSGENRDKKHRCSMQDSQYPIFLSFRFVLVFIVQASLQ